MSHHVIPSGEAREIWDEYRVPFLYSTNGEQVCFIDVRPENSYSRQISVVHTADALAELFARDLDFSWFSENELTIPRLWKYQRLAIQKIEQATEGGERNMLVAMATGTGGVDIPKKFDWNSLKNRSGMDLTDHYTEILRQLREEEGILGDIFAQSMPRLPNPVMAWIQAIGARSSEA